MQNKTDAELMHDVIDKHRPALEELYDRYVRLVYSFAMKATKQEQASREIVQLVFTRLWTTEKYDPAKGQFVNWLLTVTRNITIDYVRREKRQQAAVRMEPEQWGKLADRPENAPEHVVDRNMMKQYIQQAYRYLSENQIELIDHVYWKGHTLSELAVLQGVPIGTVKSRLHQALTILRKHLLAGKEG